MSLSLLLIMSSGCSLFQEKKELSNFTDDVIEIKANKPEKPEKLNMANVEFIVITKDNINTIQNLLESGVSLIAVTTKGYENLSLNMAELKRYIKQQKQIILYYEKINTNTGSSYESNDTSNGSNTD